MSRFQILRRGRAFFTGGLAGRLSPYTNIYDTIGKITPYFALDTESREVFDSIEDLLSSKSLDIPEMGYLLQGYMMQESTGCLTLLSNKSIKESGHGSIAVPEQVLDRTMYEPSKSMRSIQYLFDNNVIRIWRDDVLEGGNETNSQHGEKGSSDTGDRRIKALPKA